MASTQDLKILLAAQRPLVEALRALGRDAFRAAGVAEGLILPESFGDQSVRDAALAAALPGLAKLKAADDALVPKINSLLLELATIRSSLQAVAAEYVPPAQPETESTPEEAPEA